VSGRVARAEWRWAAAVAAVVLVLSSLPHVLGYLSQSAERVFVGAVYDWEDYYSHLAKMRQGMQGSWQYRILFTPEDHDGAYINLFYIALGHLAAVFGLSPMLVYHLARLLCVAALLLAVYWFVAAFALDRAVRRTAYLLACFSSGLGWLVLLVTRSYTLGGITPVDFWFIEMYTFFTAATFPHTCLAQAVHLLAFALMVRLLRGEGGWQAWSTATGAGLVLAVVHPYSLLPLDLSLGLYWLYLVAFRRGGAARRLIWLVGFAMVPLPLMVYQYWVIASNPVLRAWQAQSYTLSPPPLHYLLGYGLVLILAVWGGVRVLREREGQESAVALVLWPLAVAPLLYAPLVFNLQRRMIEGVHVSLAILAAVGLEDGLLPLVQRSRLAGWLARRRYPRPRFRRLVGLLLLALTTPSTWYLLASLGLAAVGGYDPLYYSRAEVEAILWLGGHTRCQDTVLSSYAVGGYIPARIGHRVFWGHWAESIHLSQKQAEAQAFYGASEACDRVVFLDRYGIAYVFYGPRERDMGDFDPAAASYLTPVFREGDVVVYRVTLEGTP
jgi:hypothetical protein